MLAREQALPSPTPSPLLQFPWSPILSPDPPTQFASSSKPPSPPSPHFPFDLLPSPTTRFPSSSRSPYPHPILPPSHPPSSLSPLPHPPTFSSPQPPPIIPAHFTPPVLFSPSPILTPVLPTPTAGRQVRRGAGAPGSLARVQPAAQAGRRQRRAGFWRRAVWGFFYNPGRRLRKCRPRAPSPGHAAALAPSLPSCAGRRDGGRDGTEARAGWRPAAGKGAGARGPGGDA